MKRADGISLQFGAFHLAPSVDLLYRGEEVVPLEPRAVRVLRYLVEHHDRVLSKEELLEEVWSDVFTTDGVLKKAISQIRRALGEKAGQSRFIATYHGRGYRFVAPVTRVTAVPQTSEPSAGLIPYYDQLAGRDAEMLTLGAALRSAVAGSPRPVAIGEPGIGRTQFVRRFFRRTRPRPRVSGGVRSVTPENGAGVRPYLVKRGGKTVADFNKDFDNYKLYYASQHPNQVEAIIQCWKGNVYIGNILFFRDGSPIPPNNIQTSNVPVTATVNYSLSRFHDVMTILRYEKPVYLFVSETLSNGWVSTATGEPVGEQEP